MLQQNGNGQGHVQTNDAGHATIPPSKFTRSSRTKGYVPSVVGGAWPWLGGGDGPYFSLGQVEPMRRDPRVKFGLKLLKAPVHTASWHVLPEGSEVAKLVDSTLKRIWKQDLDKILRFLEYGFAGGEVIYKQEDDLIEFDHLKDFNPFDLKALQLDGELWGIQIGHVAGSQIVRLSAPNYWWIANEVEFGQHYGRSKLRGSYEPWIEKRGRHGAVGARRLWAQKCSFSGGTFSHPPGETLIGNDPSGNPKYMSNQDIARQTIEYFEAGGMMVFPQVFDENGNPLWHYDPPQINGDFEQLIQYPKELDAEILEGLEVAREMAAAMESGSGFAGRAVPALTFYQGEDAIIDAIIAMVEKQILKPLVEVNHGERSARPLPAARRKFKIEVTSLIPKEEGAEQPAGGQPGQPPPGQPPGASPMPGGGPPPGGAAPPPGGGGGAPSPEQGTALQKLLSGQGSPPKGTRMSRGPQTPERILFTDDSEPTIRLSDWTAYRGPRGGRGWKHLRTGRVVYEDEAPLSRGGGGASEPEPASTQATSHPHAAALHAIPHGELHHVGGWPVRRLGDAEWRIETDRSHVTGDLGAITGHLDKDRQLRGLEGKRVAEALTRAAKATEPDALREPERAETEDAAFGKLPKGTRVVSLDQKTLGRLGTIVHDEETGNRVKLDGAPDFASNFVEPLEAERSWRTPKAETEKERQAKLFEEPERSSKAAEKLDTLHEHKPATMEDAGDFFGVKPEQRLLFSFGITDPLMLAIMRCPKGYTRKSPLVLNQRSFVGGMFIPNRDMQEAEKRVAAGTASPQEKLRSIGPVDPQALKERLEPYRDVKLNFGNMTASRKAYHALKLHHDQDFHHRIAQLVEQDEESYRATRSPTVAKRLHAYAEMLQWHDLDVQSAIETNRAAKVGVKSVPTTRLDVDPERFQYKADVSGKFGVGSEFKDVGKFNPDFAGVILVWHDKQRNKDYVVNGHHRYELAHRTGHPNLDVRYIQAKDAVAARAIGALANIAGGKGTAVDAARWMKDTGSTAADMAKEGVSMRGAIAKDATVLAGLEGGIFQKVVLKQMPVKRALIIGTFLPNDHEGQAFLMQELAKAEQPKGRAKKPNVMSDAEVEEMAREIHEAPKVKLADNDQSRYDLFASEGDKHNTFRERLKLKASLRKAFAHEANVFQSVATEGKAETLSRGENVINFEKNKKLAREAEQEKNLFATLSGLRAGMSGIFDQYAQELYEHPKQQKSIIAKATKEVRAAMKEATNPQPFRQASAARDTTKDRTDSEAPNVASVLNE